MPAASSAIKGKLAWTQTRVLGTATFLNAVTNYDDKGRVIQVQNTNLTGGTDITSTQYSWAGQPLAVLQRQQNNNNSQEHLVITKMSYDELGRVAEIRKAVSSTVAGVAVTKAEQLIVKNEYDKLGQLKTKKLAPSFLPMQVFLRLAPTVQSAYAAAGVFTGQHQRFLRCWCSNV